MRIDHAVMLVFSGPACDTQTLYLVAMPRDLAVLDHAYMSFKHMCR